MVSWLKFRSLQ